MRKQWLPMVVVCGFFLVSSVAALQDPGERPIKRRSRAAAADDQGGPPDDGIQSGGPGGPAAFLRMFPLMAAIDADGNGEISSKEIKRAAGALRTLDTDENGTLTEDELRPNLPPFGGPGGGGPPGGGPGAGGFGQPRGRGGPEAFVNRAMEFDEDQDGKLSREELTKMASQFGRPPRGDGNPGAGGNNPATPPDQQ